MSNLACHLLGIKIMHTQLVFLLRDAFNWQSGTFPFVI